MSTERSRRTRIMAAAAALLSTTALALPAWSQTVTILQAEPPESLEPGNMGGTYNMSVLATMYENLVALDENLERTPGLATEWSASEDGLVWTFKLREGVTFHDGTPFDAEAVKFTFDRLLDENLGLPSGGRFRPVIDEVVVVDPLTVEFRLDVVYPAFPGLVAIMHAGIVNPNPEVQATLDTQGSGTGPFRFVEWRTGEYVLQAAYDGYWGEPAAVDEIRWIWSAEPSVGNMALMTGDADVVNAPAPVFAQQIGANPDLVLHQSPSSRVYWVALNMEMEPFDDVRVRQALNYATDREALVGALMFGFGSPANSPLGEAVFGYDDTLLPYVHDVEMARSLLAEAG